jgi:hypothetical protein
MLQDKIGHYLLFYFLGLSQLINFKSKKNVKIINLKCADCFCDIDECKVSISPFECQDCILDKCCCWESVHKSKYLPNT